MSIILCLTFTLIVFKSLVAFIYKKKSYRILWHVWEHLRSVSMSKNFTIIRRTSSGISCKSKWFVWFISLLYILLQKNAFFHLGYYTTIWKQSSCTVHTYLTKMSHPNARILHTKMQPFRSKLVTIVMPREIEIIHRLFLGIAMYCQASSMNH